MYGLVKITDGKYKGRIGYYDDDEYKCLCEFNEDDDNFECYGKKCNSQAVVYWGDWYLSSNRYSLINSIFVDDNITTMDLIIRLRSIMKEISNLKYGNSKYSAEKHVDLLSEYELADSLLTEKYKNAREDNGEKGKIFLSHSSKDKTFVKSVATDLADKGYEPWLDEWQIKVGESIPRKIDNALDECKYFMIFLSKNSAESKWVEEELYAAYGSIFSNNSEKVILPILIEECEIPFILRQYKYANFLYDYTNGLKELLDALK